MNSLPDSTQTVLQDIQSLPVKYLFTLKPWFPEETLRQGHQIIREKQVTSFVFMRRFSGLILDGNTSVLLQMAKGKRQLPFVFRDGNCSACGRQAGGGNCEHVAALALLCLQEHDTSLCTLADLFVNTPWDVIGRYLYEQISMRRNIEIVFTAHDNGMLLSGSSDNGLNLKIVLSTGAMSELVDFFPDICKELSFSRGRGSGDCQGLINDLIQCTGTGSEKHLAAAGLTSRKQKYEISLWRFLARLLFLHFPDPDIQIKQDADGIYILHCTANESTVFSLSLPRNNTWELLNELSLPGIPAQVERVEQFSHVTFCSDSADIKVSHCCRFRDGTEHKLSDIKKYRYGSRYQIDDMVFTLNSVPGDEQLRQTQEKQLSLFAAIGNNAADGRYGFVVAEKDVANFLENNTSRLRFRRHQVSEDILKMKVVSLPEELVITEYREDKDWCYLAGWYGMGNHKISLDALLSAVAAGKTLLTGKTWLDLIDSPLAWFHELGTSRFAGEDGCIKMTRGEFLALSSQISTIDTRCREITGTLAAFLQSDDTIPPLKTNPAKHLRPYQRHGCSWLYQLHHYRLGGILADDMGLGKTHQALGLIALLEDEASHFLIVCPAAVLYHWPEKQESFFPQLSLAVYHGSGRNLSDAMKRQVIVTSYGVMRQDAELLGEYSFKLLFFDEMHVLKNKKTATYGAVSLLHAENIIGLTGTPIENSVQELETLLSLCLPEIFTARPVKHQFKYANTKKQRQQLQKLVAPFILRRTREQVLRELPECSEDIRICELSADQIEAYREAAGNARDLVDEYLEPGQQTSFTTILATIIRLKQICNHLCQLEKSTDYTLYKSGKWDEFTRLVSQCQESGLKVVVFSQFTAMLDIIESWLSDRKIDFVAIRGSVAARERSERIKHFNTDKKCKICCASLLAGGTGVDLTGAQVVIHYDRWWNPAKEEQATARVYRMGQKHPVQVYKLVTAGTLEEKIHGLIEEKRALAADLIVEDDGSVLKSLSREDLAGLFSFNGNES